DCRELRHQAAALSPPTWLFHCPVCRCRMGRPYGREVSGVPSTTDGIEHIRQGQPQYPSDGSISQSPAGEGVRHTAETPFFVLLLCRIFAVFGTISPAWHDVARPLRWGHEPLQPYPPISCEE